MEFIQNQNQEQNNHRQLGYSELQSLLFLSFKFSQGNAARQEEILRNATLFYGKQNIPDDWRARLSASIDKIVRNLVNMELHKTGAETDDFYENYFKILEKDQEGFTDYESLFHFFLEKDLEYYTKNPRGIPNRDKAKDGDNTIADRHLSMFVNFVIRGDKSGDKSIDNLMRELRLLLSFMNNLPFDLNWEKFVLNPKEGVNFVMEVIHYNRLHPEAEISESDTHKYASFFKLLMYYNGTHPNTKVTIKELRDLGINVKG
jgi:hypothetical protein